MANQGFFSGSFSWVKASTGYIDDYISNKRYVTNDTATFNPNSAFKAFGIHSQQASVSLLLFERWQIYATAGGSKLRVKWQAAPPTTTFQLSSNYQFSWSVGSRLTLISIGPLALGVQGLYFEMPRSHHNYFRFLNRLNLPLETARQESKISEWDASGAAALKLWFLCPYAGLQYINSKLEIGAGPQNPKLKYHNRESMGYFYGLTLLLSSKFMVSGERRTTGEFAYTLSTEAIF